MPGRVKVFIDTSAFVALRNGADPNHVDARQAWERLGEDPISLITSNLVFAETYTALLVRVGRDAAVTWGRGMRSTEAIETVRVDAEIEEAAWAILETHDDKRWSYVDAASFAMMEREGIDLAFAFDQHFRQRGLRLLSV